MSINIILAVLAVLALICAHIQHEAVFREYKEAARRREAELDKWIKENSR